MKLIWIALVSFSIAWILMVSALKTAEQIAISLVKQESITDTN